MTPTQQQTVTPTMTPTTAPAAGSVVQTIHVDLIANHHFGDAPFVVRASGGGSGNPVTFRATGHCIASGRHGSTISLTGAGICVVTASQAGGGAYSAAVPISHSFTIAKATPRISWPKPAAIRAAAPLGKRQLDAQAGFEGKGLKGTYAYVPRAGTKLTAGHWTLRVTFTPADRADFLTVRTTTTITVVQ